MSRRLWLSLRRLLEVHSSGDCGSPRVSGSTSARRSSSKFASVSLTGLRPPPARRTRSKSGVSPARNSASPRPIVLRAIPVARITATIPPCPADVASAAAKRRRPRSSSTGASASKRWRMADSSITPKRYSLVIPEGIPPANKIPPDPIHLFADRPLAAKILVQQAEQQVVLPDAVDAEIASRQTFAIESAFLEHPDRRRIGGNAGGLDAVKIELTEQRRQQHAQRRRHVAAMCMGLPDPVPDRSGLHNAAADIRQRDAADHRTIGFAEHDEWIGSVGGDIFGIAPQPPPEARTRKIIGRPDRFPGRQIFPAEFAQMRPLQKIGHLRRTQQQAIPARRKRRRSAGWQTEQSHV